MSLLAIDVGTTHCKAGLFAEDGSALQIATRELPRTTAAGGTVAFAPEALWHTVLAVVGAATAAAGRPRIAAIGIASMAETGLLIDRRNGEPRTPFLPWFDPSSAAQAERLAQQAPDAERFRAFGIYPSFKCSLTKILRARDGDPALISDAVWLSVADYVAYRLTGVQATDYSLAGRTYAFDLAARDWHGPWLREFHLPDDLFPPARPSGTVLGVVADHALDPIGLTAGTPVAISGHDHICAAVAGGAIWPGHALDSMGTAEALLGATDRNPLGEVGWRSGLTFGILPWTNGYYWLGGLSTAGGALDWLRSVLGEPPLDYAGVAALAAQMGDEPGSLLFLPYLAGSGAPEPNPAARGAFIGLTSAHTRADLLRAVLEGIAYQMEAIRRAAAPLTDLPIDRITVAGGGARLPRWLQIKADIYGLPLDTLTTDEATLLGAALIAGVGSGVYRSQEEAVTVARAHRSESILPRPAQHTLYAQTFADTFQPWHRRLTKNKADQQE